MSTQNKEEELREGFREYIDKMSTNIFIQSDLDFKLITDYWLKELSQREATSRKELVEGIEKMKRYFLEKKHKTSKNREIRYLAGRLDDAEKSYNKAIEDVLSFINNKEEPKLKSEYRCDEDRRPRWVTFDIQTNEIISDEKYNHQDGNFSNLCASEYCKCKQ